MTAAVLVHGAGGGGWEWRIWAETLRIGGFDVLAPDLQPARGDLAATRLADYRAQVVDWCRTAASPFVLIGASLGGLLALAAAGPTAPAALILVNAMPPSGIEPRPDFRRRPSVVPWSMSPLANTHAALPDADAATVRWTHRRWRDESGRVLNEAAAGITVEAPECPILVMASGDDDDIPPVSSRSLADAFSADFVELPGCSHLGILLGRSAATAAAVAVAWLNACSTAGNSD